MSPTEVTEAFLATLPDEQFERVYAEMQFQQGGVSDDDLVDAVKERSRQRAAAERLRKALDGKS